MIFPLFSKPVFITHIEFDKEKIVKETKNINFEKINTSDYKPTASWISDSLKILNKPIFEELKKPILEKFNEYVYDFLKYNNYKFRIKNSWLTKTNFLEKSETHNHRDSCFSGVLYLQTEKMKGDISFFDLSKNGQIFKPSENTIFNSEIWTFNLNENNLIFFPSEMHHKIDINKTHTERLSLAMDFETCD
jgi:uncharacterized protein (TIGR02466 family)